MQSYPLRHLPQGHVDRLRHARRRGPRRVPRRRAVHLSVTHTDEEPGSTTTAWTSAAADPATGPALSAVPVPTQQAMWGRRRLAAATVLAPVLFGLLVRSGGGWTPQPTRGMSWRDTLGCSPCAVVLFGLVQRTGSTTTCST